MKRQWHYAGDSRNWPAGSWTRNQIEKFMGQKFDDDDGLQRTITIDECDRKQVARELAKYLKT